MNGTTQMELSRQLEELVTDLLPSGTGEPRATFEVVETILVVRSFTGRARPDPTGQGESTHGTVVIRDGAEIHGSDSTPAGITRRSEGLS